MRCRPSWPEGKIFCEDLDGEFSEKILLCNLRDTKARLRFFAEKSCHAACGKT
jgi:hypothetical protein